jgi:hypothetical protein
MPHVLFVHGIGNRLAADKLQESWLHSLADNAGIDLRAAGIEKTMLYWADVLYPSPEPNESANESTHEIAEVDASAARVPPAPSIEEAAFMAGLAAKIGGTLAAADTVEAITEDRMSGGAYERVPLPWPLKNGFLETFLLQADGAAADQRHRRAKTTTRRHAIVKYMRGLHPRGALRGMLRI